jgi:hypothetical protein
MVGLAHARGDEPSVEGVGIEVYGEANAQWLQTGAGNPYVGDVILRRFTFEVEKEIGSFAALAALEREPLALVPRDEALLDLHGAAAAIARDRVLPLERRERC